MVLCRQHRSRRDGENNQSHIGSISFPHDSTLARGLIHNHSSAPTTARAPDTSSAASQPKRAARTGVSAGEIRPPTLLPMFMTPPAVPLRGPALPVIVAQHGPSVLRTSAVASARQVAAKYAFPV